MLAIKINGIPYVNFTEASVSASVTAMARGFSFVSTADENNDFPVKIGDRVIITADGTQIIDGFIESLEVNYNEFSHDIRVNGRSFMADFVDSTVPTQFEQSGTTLQAIAANLLSSIGISATIDNQAGSIRDFGNDITSAEIGQNALEFLESYSRKRQILLTSDGASTMVFARAGTLNAPAELKNVNGARDNNILESTLNIDYANRFYRYVIKSQLNPATEGFSFIPRETVSQEGIANDDEIRTSRKIEMNAEESSESFTATDRAVWEKNIRIGNAWNYTATVAGNSVNGALWLPNTLVRVTDQFCQIDSKTLLIRDVQYDYDVNRGSRTRMNIIKREALTLEVEQSARQTNTKKEGDNFLAGLIGSINI